MTSALLDVAGIAVSPDHYIDGRRVASSETFELRSPIDQRVLGQVAEGLHAHVDAAISAAAKGQLRLDDGRVVDPATVTHLPPSSSARPAAT